jgi:RNA-directed DNA polymerase
METTSLYSQVCDVNNLIRAWQRARKHKTKKDYVIEFEANLKENLERLSKELINQTYKPEPLKTFILRDPKTRKINKSAFGDRIVHHALVQVIEPIFDKIFIYDCCANRVGKGNLFALNRLDFFKRKVTNNLMSNAFCLKADIKHYFDEVNHDVLISIIKRKISDNQVIWLIGQILNNMPHRMFGGGKCSLKGTLDYYLSKSSQSALCQFKNKNQSKPNSSGMPLGNLTSQFFANVYLNELDYYVKHKLRAKYYIRYVDDFVILHESKEQLEIWKSEIDKFLTDNLKIELHPEKSKIISISKGIDFVGFRNFWKHRLLRKRNIRKMIHKIEDYKLGNLSKNKILESFQGWNAYAKWANSFNLRKRVVKIIYSNPR